MYLGLCRINLFEFNKHFLQGDTDMQIFIFYRDLPQVKYVMPSHWSDPEVCYKSTLFKQKQNRIKVHILKQRFQEAF